MRRDGRNQKERIFYFQPKLSLTLTGSITTRNGPRELKLQFQFIHLSHGRIQPPGYPHVPLWLCYFRLSGHQNIDPF